jgi:small subunit ribosomal protein S1
MPATCSRKATKSPPWSSTSTARSRSIKLSIKAKDDADQQEAMKPCRPASERENAGTTSLGALLRAKLDNKQ